MISSPLPIPFKQYIEADHSVIDLFVNDECSKCGSCCSRFLPISDKEIKNIKKYIKNKKLKIVPAYQKTCLSEVINGNCPFLDLDAENKCQIYPVRPAICKIYSCRDHVHGNFNLNITLPTLKVKNLYEVFNFGG